MCLFLSIEFHLDSPGLRPEAEGFPSPVGAWRFGGWQWWQLLAVARKTIGKP